MTRQFAFRFLFLCSFVFAAVAGFAQLQSPAAFLGYQIGSRYTPHWRIVEYVKSVAAASPQTVKLQTYGQTNEGRPLMLAFISSEENISNLENIRKNNLRLANLSKDRMAAQENMPPIVWLSYNVHGNETSSSEAAMLTLYALTGPDHPEAKEWLKKVVVVIDPCINPDGRDRYVNWFNTVVGTHYNPDPIAREHREPWPGGRTNHYNFDLNRDWAWQTQIETQQRLAVYNQWLPQIHVDFHEQGVNSPYYFAPAAQPYHEMLTSWQRQFQDTIGRNHARYFDKEGWLYFTKEVFDLFYPSYGDTYPLYNGAIGMTYEQAGNGSAGLGIYKQEGDTLTLTDRAMHHYTTGMSTIETAANHASQLIVQFHRFYNDAVSKGTGTYKSFVIKTADVPAQKLKALLQLLDRNAIQYGKAAAGSSKGFHYSSGKEESFSISGDDILISAIQPKSTLTSVLFEPKANLVDSNTYDITAWSLPYVYGLDAYALKDKINSTGGYSVPEMMQTMQIPSYGAAIRWEGMETAKAVGKLLQAGYTLRYSTVPFKIGTVDFNRGTVLILPGSNRKMADSLWGVANRICGESNVMLYPVNTGFADAGADFGSSKMHYFKAPHIAMITGEGTDGNAAGEVWHFFDKELEYPVTLVNLSDAGRMKLADFDVIILPDGRYNSFFSKDRLEEWTSWVRSGGKLIAMEGGLRALANSDLGLKLKKAEPAPDSDKKDFPRYEDQERDYLTNSTPGAIYKVMLDNSHPLAYGYGDWFYTVKRDDVVYDYLDGAGWNVGTINADGAVSGFVGSNAKRSIKDGLLVAEKEVGRGSVVCFADDLLFRDFWYGGKLMFCNAVFLSGQ